MIKKFLNWKGGLIVGATTAILIAAIASPIVGKNAIDASYNEKINQRTGVEAATQSVQKFTITEENFKTGVAKLQLNDKYKDRLTASTALELHNDKSYSFELIDAVDLKALKDKDPDMEFELRTISKTENSSNPSVATKDGVINNIYVIGTDTKNNIFYQATGSISGFLPDAQVNASNNFFIKSTESSIKVKDEVQDKTATAVALKLQELFSQNLTPKSGNTTAPVAPKTPANPATPANPGTPGQSAGTPGQSAGTPGQSAGTSTAPVDNPKAPSTTSAEGRRPKQADGQTVASQTSTTSTTSSRELAHAFKVALAEVGGFNLKDTNGDFTFLPDSYYIAPVVDANNKLKFSNVNNINQTLSIDVEIVGPDGTKLPTTLNFTNLGNTSQDTQDKLIQSFANSYKLKPGIAKALATAHLGIADVVYAPSLPTELANVAPFNTQDANVKDFGFWFEKVSGQQFGSSSNSDLSGFAINIAQGDAAPSAEEIESLKATDSLKLSIQYQQKEGSSSIPQGINVDTAKTFQAGTNLILDTRGETVNQLVADSLPSQQGTVQSSQPQNASKFSFDIDSKAPILFANHLDNAIAAFNASSASNINLAVSQLAFLLDRSGNDAKLDEKTYGQYIKDTLTSFNDALPKGVTLALKGQFDKQTSKYTIYVKAMAGSKELKAYSFDISNVSAPNYAYDAASKFGADVFVDATFDRLVEQKETTKPGTTGGMQSTTGTEALKLQNYDSSKQIFTLSDKTKFEFSSQGLALKNKDEVLKFSDSANKSTSGNNTEETTLKNGTLWLAFKASQLKTGIRTYFLASKTSSSNENEVGLFIEKVPNIASTINTEAGVGKINKEGYIIGITYNNVQGSNGGDKASGDIVALFTSTSKGVIEKTDHKVFQLLKSTEVSSGANKTGVEYKDSSFKNTFNGDLDYGDFISKTNNDDPTLLLEINIKNLPDPSKSKDIKNSINFTLYSSAIKNPLNNPIKSEFSQPVYVDSTPYSADKKATSFINRGIDFYSIGDPAFGSEQNHITFKAMAVFKDKDEHGVTQNSEVRRQIAKAFIKQYFTEDQEAEGAQNQGKQTQSSNTSNSTN
ncbi:P110/LppT family adhesin N-terminal domain [Mesomycoplasma bovoculi]|uniref:p102/LppT family protein n=1 Tax=Mesomycoplasma bovoculi M165/69 TaxID=743966 RepID=W5V0E3_9BACT|nr:P110/LppT family adhesin N-terminal domain [Mesomycoplasma bovoculi]AHH45268.1 P102/LppT family protein [Mesomycoplasma bovoculi M165/69]